MSANRLTGTALDEAVARAMGRKIVSGGGGWRTIQDGGLYRCAPGAGDCLVDHRGRAWCPSTDYALLPEMEAWCHERGISLSHAMDPRSHPGWLHAVDLDVADRRPLVTGHGATYPEALSRAIVAAAGTSND